MQKKSFKADYNWCNFFNHTCRNPSKLRHVGGTNMATTKKAAAKKAAPKKAAAKKAAPKKKAAAKKTK